jgi:drug/metabolite transporter (DMT)-like permease
MEKKPPIWINYFINTVAGNVLLSVNSLCLIGLAIYVFVLHEEKTTFQLWGGVFIFLLGAFNLKGRIVWLAQYKNKQHQ